MNSTALLVGLSLVVALVVVQGVGAHAAPAKIAPGDGAVLVSSPARVTIEMSQELARQAGSNDIDVFSSTGAEITTESAVIDSKDRRIISVGLPSPLAPGKYAVKWKSLSSEDGDPAEGELSFTVDPAGPANPGNEVLRVPLGATAAGSPSPVETNGTLKVAQSPQGVTWALVIAVGIAALVVGAGGTFLLMERSQPSPRSSGSERSK